MLNGNTSPRQQYMDIVYGGFQCAVNKLTSLRSEEVIRIFIVQTICGCDGNMQLSWE